MAGAAAVAFPQGTPLPTSPLKKGGGEKRRPHAPEF